jgi:hypothetical protein
MKFIDADEDAKRELLDKLNELWIATQYDDNNNKVRRGSDEERYRDTALRKAVLDAINRFSSHKKFMAWLDKNDESGCIASYDPLRSPAEMRNTVYDLQQKVEWLEKRLNMEVEDTSKVLMSIGLELGRLKKEKV